MREELRGALGRGWCALVLVLVFGRGGLVVVGETADEEGMEGLGGEGAGWVNIECSVFCGGVEVGG